MVKLDNYDVQLDRENAIFFPGEEVSGNVFIKIKEPLKVNGIRIEFKGEAYATWRNGKIEYVSRDTIFEIKEPILEKQPNSNDLYLDTFENNFRFKFILPKDNLPTSYEYYCAYIRYWVKATIDIPWLINKHAIKCFTVINSLDLNLLPGIRQPCGVSDTKTVCCGPCQSNPITIDLNTNKSGFVPGEMIIFNASIDNRSSRTIKPISALLVQHTEFSCPTFYGKPVRNFHSHTIIELPYSGPEIGPRLQGNWSNGRIKIPPICPSLQDTCKVIKVEYKLTLVVNVSGISLKKHVSVPIVIGTVPFTDSNVLSSNLNIIYFKSILDLKGKSKQYFRNEQYEKEMEEDDKSTKFEPKYPYYKDFYLDKY